MKSKSNIRYPFAIRITDGEYKTLYGCHQPALKGAILIRVSEDLYYDLMDGVAVPVHQNCIADIYPLNNGVTVTITQERNHEI